MESHFKPDASHLLDVAYNRRPRRLPLYEHWIDAPFIAKVLGREVGLQGRRPEDYEAFHREVVGFWRAMTYDAVAYEAAVCEIFPGHGAILGGGPGPIRSRADFEKYPFDDIPQLFWEVYTPHFRALRNVMPPGMKAYGGCGFGIFESSEDLVGFEPLCVMQYEDPGLFADLYKRIGDLYVTLWTKLIFLYGDLFVFFRMGDDLGFKTSTLMAPDTYRKFLFPQYKRIIDLIHSSGKKFCLHSCGNIFDVMDDLIRLGIDAKHSNEDEIAPFGEWIDRYAERIGLFGGIDVNTLCLKKPDDVFGEVLEKGTEFRRRARGYGLGSGNSIPHYVPVEGFIAMIDAVKEIRRREGTV